MIGGHLPSEGAYRPILSIYPHHTLAVAHKVPEHAFFRSFLCPHHDWLFQPEPIHVITLLAVRLHGDHKAAASRIDTQPDSLFQLRGVGDTTRHQPLTGNFEDFVTRLSVGFLQQRFQIALIKALEQHTPTAPQSWPPPSPSDPWTAGRKI